MIVALFLYLSCMESEKKIEGMQLRCPVCNNTLPVRIVELEGKARISIRCPHCKRKSMLELQDIFSAG